MSGLCDGVLVGTGAVVEELKLVRVPDYDIVHEHDHIPSFLPQSWTIEGDLKPEHDRTHLLAPLAEDALMRVHGEPARVAVCCLDGLLEVGQE